MEGGGKMTENERSSSSDSGSIELPPHLSDTGDTFNSSILHLGNCSRNEVIRSSLAELPQDSPLLPCVSLSEIDIRRLSTLVSVIKAGQQEIVNDCCLVFKGDFLRDFPAQAFLQEPAILESLINLCEQNIALGKNQETVVNALESLRRLAEALTAQIYKYVDPKFVVLSDQVLDAGASKHSWSILEFIWAATTISATCIRNSEQFSVLNEAVCLLKTCLAMHHGFFPSSCSAEVGRLSLLLADVLDSKPPAFVFIQVLHVIKRYLQHRPEALKSSHVLAEVLQKSVVHAGVWIFNSGVRSFFIEQLKSKRPNAEFSEILSSITEMCQAISSAQGLVKTSRTKRLSPDEIRQAVLSLDFIPDPKVAAGAIDALSWAKITEPEPLLSLLAYPVEEIQLAVYQKISKIVDGSIGEEQAINPMLYSPENILFLCDTKVVQEMATFGLEHPNARINSFSEDILIGLVKSRLLVSPNLWSQVASTLAFLCPVIVSKCEGRKCLQEAVFGYYDLSNQSLSQLELIKGNSCFMFSNQEAVRAEATKRLLTLLKQDFRAHEMWPQTSIIEITNPAMASLCLVKHQLKLNCSPPGIYYNETSLRQIVSLLGPGDAEPTIKYSALCQLAAMLQEPGLIAPFLQSDGLRLTTKLLDDALVQTNTDVLSKCVVPIVSILLQTLAKHTSLIQELTQDEVFLTNLIRAMFLYSSFDSDFKLHHSCLLALVLFSDFLLKKTSSSGEECLVLPHSIASSLCIPFEATSYGKVSSYTPNNQWLKMKLKVGDYSTAENLSLLLRCHSAVEQFGTLPEVLPSKGLLSKEEVNFLLQFDPKTTLTRALDSIQSAASHSQVLSLLPIIISYVQCVAAEELKTFGWEEAFARFLLQPPSTQDDSDLLNAVAHIVSRYKVNHWISAKGLCLKLDHRQAWCVQTFVPLLQSCLPNMDTSDLTSTMRFLCNCLVHNFSANSEGGMRVVLTCFRELTCGQNIELSSRLLADLIVPLVNIVHTYDQDNSFVGINLIDLSLECLVAIQSNNLQNFFHHFYVYSEQCDIMNVLTHIISADKMELKASCLALLSGLAKSNGFKNYKLDFSRNIDLAINLALDLKEPSLVKSEALTLISTLLDYNAVDEYEEKCNYLSLLKHDWFGQISWLHKGLYLLESFQFYELNLVSSPCEESPSGLIKQLVTPDLLAKHYALLYNFISSSNCDAILKEIHDHKLFQKSVMVLSECINEKTELTPGVCALTNAYARFISICLISDESDQNQFGNIILDFPFLSAQLVRTLDRPDFGFIASSILWLVIALLQGGHYSLFEDSFQQGQFWPALSIALQSPESEHSAMLLIRALTIEGDVDCSSFTNDDQVLEELCRALMSNLVKDETHQHAMAALAGLLATCDAAKLCIFKLGLLEGVVTALKHCLNGLLEVNDRKRIGSVSQGKMHPLIEELIDSFELLTSFVLDNPKIKRAVTQTILPEEINILWPVCILNSKLLATALKFLLAYTEDCEIACATLLLRKQLLTDVTSKHSASSDSLLHQLVKLMNTEVKVHKSLDTVHNVLTILCQCCVSQECRSALVKAAVFSKSFSENNGIIQMPSKTQLAILRLMENISRYPEGQLFVARIPDGVDFFSSNAFASTEIAQTCTEILRNICFSNANRVLILNSGVLLAALLKILEKGDPEKVHPVATALWALAANNHRTKQALKAAGFPLALSKAKLACAHHPEVLDTINSAIITIER